MKKEPFDRKAYIKEGLKNSIPCWIIFIISVLVTLPLVWERLDIWGTLLNFGLIMGVIVVAGIGQMDQDERIHNGTYADIKHDERGLFEYIEDNNPEIAAAKQRKMEELRRKREGEGQDYEL